jgi:hypothetical protein
MLHSIINPKVIQILVKRPSLEGYVIAKNDLLFISFYLSILRIFLKPIFIYDTTRISVRKEYSSFESNRNILIKVSQENFTHVESKGTESMFLSIFYIPSEKTVVSVAIWMSSRYKNGSLRQLLWSIAQKT